MIHLFILNETTSYYSCYRKLSSMAEESETEISAENHAFRKGKPWFSMYSVTVPDEMP